MPMIVTSRGRRATPAGLARGGLFRGRDYATYLPRPGGLVEIVDRRLVQGSYGANTIGVQTERGFAVRGTSTALASSTGLILPDGAFDLSGRGAYSIVAVCTMWTNNTSGGDAALFRADDDADQSRTQVGFSFTADGSTMSWHSLAVTDGGVTGWTASAFVSDTAPPVGRLLVMSTRWATSGRIESMWSVAGGGMRSWVSAAHNPTGSVSWSSGGFASQLNAHIGGMAHSSGVAFPGDIYAVSVLPFRISDTEAAQVVADPFTALFGTVRRPVFFAAGGGVYDVALSESASASDSLGASGALTSALAEAASAGDVVSAAAAFAAAMSEAVTAGDSSAGSTVRAGALSEAAVTGDALMAGATLAGSISEAATASDVISSAGALLAALSEAASAADAIDGSVGAATYSATLAEAASAGDAWSSAAVIAAAIVEAVTAGDTVASIATMAAAITEAAASADQVAAAATMALAISEAVTAADAWSGAVGAAVLSAELSEAVTAGDVFAALELLARFGVRGARGVSVQANARRAQLQRSVRRN